MLFATDKGRIDSGLCLDPPVRPPLGHLIEGDDLALFWQVRSLAMAATVHKIGGTSGVSYLTDGQCLQWVRSRS